MEGKEVYTFSDRAIEQYNALGISSRPRPMLADVHLTMFPGLRSGQYYDGRMPLVLKKLSLDDISALLSLQTNWHAYLSTQYALVAARRSEAKKKKEFLWSMVRMRWQAVGKAHHSVYTDQKLSDLARIDRRFVEADAEYEEFNVLFNTLEAMLEVAKRELETVSREVTIRQTEIESEARGRGVGSRFTNPREERRAANVETHATPDKIKNKIAGQPKFVSGGKPPKRTRRLVQRVPRKQPETQ